MNQLDIRKYLFDMNEACELLIQCTSGKTFSDYSTDPMLRSAVERQFEIIGEALTQVLRLDGKSPAGWVLTQNPAGLPPRVGELVLSLSKGFRPPAPI